MLLRWVWDWGNIKEMNEAHICKNCKHHSCDDRTTFAMICNNPKFCKPDLVYGGLIIEFCRDQRKVQINDLPHCGEAGLGFEQKEKQ